MFLIGEWSLLETPAFSHIPDYVFRTSHALQCHWETCLGSVGLREGRTLGAFSSSSQVGPKVFPRKDMGYVGGSTVSVGQQLRKVVDSSLPRWAT